jgi:hypothetical protein
VVQGFFCGKSLYGAFVMKNIITGISIGISLTVLAFQFTPKAHHIENPQLIYETINNYGSGEYEYDDYEPENQEKVEESYV